MDELLGWIFVWYFCFGITFRYKGKRYIWSGLFIALVEKSVYDRACRIAKFRRLNKRKTNDK